MKKQNTKMLVEGALMLALAIVLSLITPFRKLLPFGGSITLVSMLPICIFSIKYGIGKGLGVSFLFAAFQFAEGAAKDGLFGWGLTAGMLTACILFDYLIAYTVLGLAGIARKKGLAGWIIGIVFALMLRFLSHFISGALYLHRPARSGMIWILSQTINTYTASSIMRHIWCRRSS